MLQRTCFRTLQRLKINTSDPYNKFSKPCALETLRPSEWGWREKPVHLKWLKMTQMFSLDLKMFLELSSALWVAVHIKVSHVSTGPPN